MLTPMRYLIAFAGSIVAVVIAFASWELVRHETALNEALDTFSKSRAGITQSIDSYEFASRGLQYGMDEEKVDRIMDDAQVKSGRMRDVAEPDLSKFQKSYEFTYHPEYQPQLSKNTHRLISEYYTVYFNSHGTAEAFDRVLFIKRDTERTGVNKWDLRTKKRVVE